MRFHIGDKVEVDASNEEGFYGSYWEATIIGKKNSTHQYVVEYKELYKEDFSARLQAVVSSHLVRPIPPKCVVKRYKVGDRVDVFYNDGWWVGTVVGLNGDGKGYYVIFEAWKDMIMYDASEIRMHQHWNEGRWCMIYPCRA